MYLDIGYLRPKSSSFLNKYSKYYIKSGMDGVIVRNIYEKVDYDQYELQLIEQFKVSITEQLPNSWKTSDYLKMLVSADLQIPVALKNLQLHLNWLNYYNTHEPDVSALETGDFYIFGIDKQSRPVIVLKNLDDGNFEQFQYFLETIKRQVLIPYFVENWTIILDMQNKEYNFYENKLNMQSLDYLMINFCGNLNNILIVHSTTTLQEAVQIIPSKLQIHQKIKIIQKLEELQQYIMPEQLEEKYGGECLNLTKFWPPIVPKTNELLKQMTLDCLDEFQQGSKKLLDFSGRQLVKFSTLGRLQRKSTMSMMKDSSHAQLSNAVIHSQNSNISSHLKIVVNEENGNELMQEDIEIQEEESDSQQDSRQPKTKKLQFLDEIQEFSNTRLPMRRNSKPIRMEMEEIKSDPSCCRSASCLIQ